MKNVGHHKSDDSEKWRRTCAPPIYDDDVSKWAIIFDQLNTFSNANTRWNHIHIEYALEVFRFALYKEKRSIN